MVFVANAGDCRAVLGKRNGSKWEAAALSRDHTATSEVEKLRREHPKEPDVVSDGRVKGILQPSRGIGDGLFKAPVFNMSYVTPIKDFHPPYTTAAPGMYFEIITS